MEYFVQSSSRWNTLSSQLRRLTSFSVGLFGSANSVTRSYPVMRKSCICQGQSLDVDNWQVEQKPGGRGREWATLGVPSLSWLLSNNRLEKVPFVSVSHTSSNRLLLSNQNKGCTPSVAHSLPLPLGPALLNLWNIPQRMCLTNVMGVLLKRYANVVISCSK